MRAFCCLNINLFFLLISFHLPVKYILAVNSEQQRSPACRRLLETPTEAFGGTGGRQEPGTCWLMLHTWNLAAPAPVGWGAAPACLVQKRCF